MNRLELRRQAARRLPPLANGSADPWPDEYRADADHKRKTHYPSTFGLTRREIAHETRRLLAAGWSWQEVAERLPVRVIDPLVPLEPIGIAEVTWTD